MRRLVERRPLVGRHQRAIAALEGLVEHGFLNLLLDIDQSARTSRRVGERREFLHGLEAAGAEVSQKRPPVAPCTPATNF